MTPFHHEGKNTILMTINYTTINISIFACVKCLLPQISHGVQSFGTLEAHPYSLTDTVIYVIVNKSK